MIDAGLGDRILLGNDLGRPSYWRSYGGGPGLDYVLSAVRSPAPGRRRVRRCDPGPVGRQPAAFPDGRVITPMKTGRRTESLSDIPKRGHFDKLNDHVSDGMRVSIWHW